MREEIANALMNAINKKVMVLACEAGMTMRAFVKEKGIPEGYIWRRKGKDKVSVMRVDTGIATCNKLGLNFSDILKECGY